MNKFSTVQHTQTLKFYYTLSVEAHFHFNKPKPNKMNQKELHPVKCAITSNEIIHFFFKDDEAFVHKIEGMNWMIFITLNNIIH